jgi:hypothetical protein
VEGLIVAGVFIGIPMVLGSIYRSHLAHQRYMKLLQLKADMNARLLDRLGNEPHVLEFLKSEVPQQMFDIRLADPAPRVPTPYSRMLTAIQIGIVLLCGGAAFLGIKPYMPLRSQEELLVFGALGVALGIGAILSAAAALAMARVWRTLDEGRA